MIAETVQLLENSQKLKPEERWGLPFPMGVFGTLRKGQWNTGLMNRAPYEKHMKAFMPHFIARGLSIFFRKDCSAPFEIFTYKPDNWKKMIPGVDSLEGFRPSRIALKENGRPEEENSYGYYRTLAWLRILPDDYEHDLYENGSLGCDRDLKIPTSEWEKYERIPAWVYSNVASNTASIKAETKTIIWG